MQLHTTNTPFYDPSIPKVAIVGRPNVGKSTLYNRLLGMRKSITDPTPGVTRDPVRALWSLYGTQVVLIDTGGLTESKEFLDAHITKKSLEAANQADILVFVVDVDGLTAEDEEFVHRLRKLSDKLVLVVNKVDNHKREAQVHEFYSLGFTPVIGVSAAHGDGVGDLLDELATRLKISDRVKYTGAVNKRSEARAAKEQALILPDDVIDEDTEPLEAPIPVPKENKAWDLSIGILGKPNTGKSTLTNLLTGTDTSLVSPVAGTTRDVIEGSFRYKHSLFRILDTAGIRRKARVHEDLEYYSVTRAIASVEEADLVFLMIDAETGLSEQDKKIAAQVVKLGRGVILVVNKWDLMDKNPSFFEKFKERMRYQFPVLSFAPILSISALKGHGVAELLDEALRIRKQLDTRLDTAKLNDLLARWTESTPPPTTSGAARWKCRYITQVSAHPVHFIMFVNKSKGFPESYLGYILNQIRRECGIKDIPIKLTLRSGAKKS